MRSRPAARKRRSRSGPVSPMTTAATARSATTSASSSRSTPLSRPPAISTTGASKARRAAMTASGWVPCESFTKRTPSMTATGSSRCSTPWNAAAADRIASGSTPNSRPTATAASALETLCAPGTVSSANGMIRPSGPVAASPTARQREPLDAVRHDPPVDQADATGQRPVAPVEDGRGRAAGEPGIVRDHRVLGIEHERPVGGHELRQPALDRPVRAERPVAVQVVGGHVRVDGHGRCPATASGAAARTARRRRDAPA